MDNVTKGRVAAVACLVFVFAAAPARGEDGYDLWLRYRPIVDEARRVEISAHATAIVAPAGGETMRVAVDELQRGLRGLTGHEASRVPAPDRGGAIVLGTPASSPAIAALRLEEALKAVGDEGYVLRSVRVQDRPVTVVAARHDIGVLYGTFHLLRLIQTSASVTSLDVSERPRLNRRLLNHWDNMDGSIERGYAGRSLWNWAALPATVDSRIADYARANASLGINGTVINSVNANARTLQPEYLDKVAAIARVLRPYGIRVYLSANFSAPRTIGGLATADPLDAAVAAWWRAKADEIYARIPDFGGFAVKANSEGQPGPQDYKRTHADGANMLADALASHGGVVMWRAFVYDDSVDPDRVKRAYLEFTRLDGTFRDNVFVQVKNGALDFQPREPFHPLFGAMPKTPLMAELQITQEYLGQSTHAVYLAPMWREFLASDTFAAGPGSTVARVIEGDVHPYADTGIAGVANTGSDRNWTGHGLAQANWHAYGRLAWNPSLSPEGLADEWVRMTWSNEARIVATITDLLLRSRETYVDYTMPLGLHHLIGGDHYAPMPENADPRRADWSAIYYHRASRDGVGVDRSRRGTDAVGQYRSPLRERWADPATTPDALLLWFHRLPWTYRMASGRTLWDEIVSHYTRGAEGAAAFEQAWQSIAGQVDAERHVAVAAKLHQQAIDAAAWRDKCVAYFRQFAQP
ncbi:Extracellular xylan exo-alpha-(1-_2)-glucuronosidase precursor [Luteitalea pratensis]|uniref:Xylan alpha-1,2-glucuronidase n=1 Tax=Luteitalea pratensis TaxID=1855912 RepID=A0A143PX23_LUTPR|nr:alpha-glucuronidase family glycosyl hydrolase [Luteitalea pratensis]AMY12339.1 Extracellular xylan exo-alpha-(1->2)-glucuronosidase precursor [Luteitalea pratensis]